MAVYHLSQNDSEKVSVRSILPLLASNRRILRTAYVILRKKRPSKKKGLSCANVESFVFVNFGRWMDLPGGQDILLL